MSYAVVILFGLTGYALGVILFHDREPIFTLKGALTTAATMTVSTALVVTVPPLRTAAAWVGQQSADTTARVVEIGFATGEAFGEGMEP